MEHTTRITCHSQDVVVPRRTTIVVLSGEDSTNHGKAFAMCHSVKSVVLEDGTLSKMRAKTFRAICLNNQLSILVFNRVKVVRDYRDATFFRNLASVTTLAVLQTEVWAFGLLKLLLAHMAPTLRVLTLENVVEELGPLRFAGLQELYSVNSNCVVTTELLNALEVLHLQGDVTFEGVVWRDTARNVKTLVLHNIKCSLAEFSLEVCSLINCGVSNVDALVTANPGLRCVTLQHSTVQVALVQALEKLELLSLATQPLETISQFCNLLQHQHLKTLHVNISSLDAYAVMAELNGLCLTAVPTMKLVLVDALMTAEAAAAWLLLSISTNLDLTMENAVVGSDVANDAPIPKTWRRMARTVSPPAE